MPAIILYGAAITTTIVYASRARRCGRLSIIQAQYLRVLYISLCAAGVAVFSGNIFNGWADGAIWSIAYAIPLTFIGVQGNRFALGGGVVLFASIIVANFFPHAIGIILALGMLIGYVGAGIATEAGRTGVAIMDELLLSKIRLSAIAELLTAEWATFPALQKAIGTTQGNLGAHLAKLVDARLRFRGEDFRRSTTANALPA